jgi:phospholipid/cholesterol/gamma-HCH transport system ATP-binding protein
MADNVVDARDLRKRFGKAEVLRGVSFTLDRRQTLVIMGGSGSGKTVLLRTVAGLIRPEGGTLQVFDIDITRLSEEELLPIRRRMGYVFQGAALFDSLTVYENVAFPLREHTDLDETMIRDIVLMKLNAVGLRGAASLDISEISGGMARRVALARAIALDPELIMYDEPFAGLDPISMAIAANLIRTLNDTTGATAILVSHDVAQCFKICDYAYLMSSRGKVVAEGTPKQLTESEDPEVRQFIRGEPDGPVRFHYPARPLAEDFGVSA